MNLKIYLISVSIVMYLTGCASSGPSKLITNGTCGYQNISGNEYIISPRYAPYVMNDFFYDPNSEKLSQRETSKFSSLINSPFKIFKTGITTVDDLKNRQPFNDGYRYEEVNYNGVPYKRDKTFSTQIITSDCSIYYISGDNIAIALQTEILNKDRTKPHENDLKKFISPTSLQEIDLSASMHHDNFKKVTKFETPAFDNALIRGAIDDKNNNLLFIQLYVNLIFFNDWGNISSAYDTEGNLHKVVKIHTDVDCSNSSILGCKLTETVGAELDKNFLINHKDGFEIKFSGSQDSVVKIPKKMVTSIINVLAIEK